MKRIAIVVVVFFFVVGLHAQKGGFNYHFSGFVDPQLFMDSRQVVGARESELLFYPAPKDLDAEGNDLNAVPNLNMLAITTRLGLKVDAPKLGEWSTGAYVEGDFTGSTESGINMLRLRHAYVQFEQGEFRDRRLLLGQYWHPMVVPEIMPGTRPLNMGMPFHPYSRYVQARYVRLRRGWGHTGLWWAATAAFQLDNSSLGPAGRSTEYLRQTGLPEGNAEMRLLWQDGKIESMVGLMANVELLRPRRYYNDAEGLRHQTGTTFPSFAFSLFGCLYFDGKWKLSCQGIYGDNLFEQGMLGGYLETLSLSGQGYGYEPFGCASIWTDFRRISGKWRPGIFLGYTQNNSFGRWFDADAAVYGRGFDIDNVWRVQPQVAFCPFDHFHFCAEIEYTSAKYGEKLKYGSSTRYRSVYAVGNTRLVLAAVLYF
ncbi:MAG: hypothetical protein J5516_09335 [Bacteroidales bacterium]|nr:hypothetical protein [Bacteroidales bacterium]